MASSLFFQTSAGRAYILDFSLATGLLGCSLLRRAPPARSPSGLCPFVNLQGKCKYLEYDMEAHKKEDELLWEGNIL